MLSEAAKNSRGASFKGMQPSPVTVVTFGSPNPGDATWAAYFNAKINARNIAFEGDVVTKVRQQHQQCSGCWPGVCNSSTADRHCDKLHQSELAYVQPSLPYGFAGVVTVLHSVLVMTRVGACCALLCYLVRPCRFPVSPAWLAAPNTQESVSPPRAVLGSTSAQAAMSYSLAQLCLSTASMMWRKAGVC